MSAGISPPRSTSLAITTAHGRLQGTLTIPTRTEALVLLAHCTPVPERFHGVLTATLHDHAIATLTLELLTRNEERFPDLQHDVPLLARRLLDGLALIKQRVQLGELPPLPLGLYAAGDCTPAAVRVSALRDADISAVVCHSGLIDLAGLLYLRTLASPLLVLVHADDPVGETSNHRALVQIPCVTKLSRITEVTAPPDSESPRSHPEHQNHVQSSVVAETLHWFLRHLHPNRPGFVRSRMETTE